MGRKDRRKAAGLRWLTRKEKAYWLDRLEEARQDGTVDAGFLPWLDAINQFEGICSCYCCTGHDHDSSDRFGYLQFRIDRRVRKTFFPAIFFSVLKIPGVIFFDFVKKSENFNRVPGDFPFIQVTWDVGDWPDVIEQVVRELKKAARR